MKKKTAEKTVELNGNSDIVSGMISRTSFLFFSVGVLFSNLQTHPVAGFYTSQITTSTINPQKSFTDKGNCATWPKHQSQLFYDLV